MRRIVIAVIGLIVVVVGLAVAGVAALNTSQVRTRIASTLSSKLGVPVSVGTLSTSILPSPALLAGQIRVGAAAGDAAPGVTLQSLRIVPDLLSLLPGHTLTIRRIDLNGLVMSILRTASGKWEAPVPPTAGGSAESGGAQRGTPAGVNVGNLQLRGGAVRVVDDSLRQPDGTPTITTITGITGAISVENGTISIPSMAAKLGQTAITCSAEMGPKGIQLHVVSPTIRGADLPKFLALTGIAADTGLSIDGPSPVELTTRVAPDFATLTAAGKASVGTVRLHSITLEKLEAPFTFTHRILALTPVTFSMYGGHQRGSVSLDLQGHTPGFTIKTSLDGLDVDQALSATTTLKHVLTGTAHAAVDLQGSGTTKPEVQRTLKGTVQFALRNGDLHGYPILAVINQGLGLTAGSTTDTKFDSLTGTAAVGGGVARTNDLSLLAEGLTVTGTGTVSFDQQLNLHLVATLVPGTASPGSPVAALTQRLTGAKGKIQIPLTVTGTTTSPHIVPDVSSVAKQQLPGILKKIF